MSIQIEPRQPRSRARHPELDAASELDSNSSTTIHVSHPIGDTVAVVTDELPATAPAVVPPASPETAKVVAPKPDEVILEAFSPARLWKKVDWVVLTWIVAMHLGALLAPFYFSWSAVAVALVLHWFSGSIGICLGYHRMLSHKSFRLAWPARFVAMFAGSLSGEGSPMAWAATHRMHHRLSDQQGDPHSPLEDAWWGHLYWLFIGRTDAERQTLYKRYIPDLINDPMMIFFERTYGITQLIPPVVLYYFGGMEWLVWGQFVRMVGMYHSTWFVNSATHLWGYRNYETRDASRNLWWVAIAAYGEGWHNNHHAHPSIAPAGHRWWELDPTWWSIKLLKMLGMASQVNDRIPAVTSRSAGADENAMVVES